MGYDRKQKRATDTQFQAEVGNATYTIKVHFNKDTDKTFKDSVQKLIINECFEKNQK